MALVRVYCGLASADRTAPTVDADGWLNAAVVDDAGRLLDVCEIGDNPGGYAKLCTVLAERSGGPTAFSIAADSDDHRLIMLLSAAGRALAIADDDAVDDYAERFADDESANEMESPPAERRAVGLARALQAGALSAVSMPAPRDLAGLKGVLVAHAALVTGRHSAAVALREVLRELHPAALRAYPDPAEPVPLAVLDALPEPYSLSGGTSGRSRDSVTTDAVVADLAGAGIADAAIIKDAITSLRVAIAETPRRAAAHKASSAAIAETIRQAVAAVRACDAACAALVTSLGERIKAPAPGRYAAKEQATSMAAPAHRGAGHRAAAPGPDHAAPDRARPETPTGRRAAREPVVDTTPAPTGRRSRSRAAADSAPTAPPPPAPMPVAPPPVAPAPAGPGPGYPTSPLAPAASATPAGPAMPLRGAPAGPPAPPAGSPLPPMGMPAGAPGMPIGAPAPSAAPVSPPAWVTGTGSNRPVSAPPPPPPGITPIVPGQRPTMPPAAAGEPFRPTVTAATKVPAPGRYEGREQPSPANSTRATRAAEGRQSVAAAVESRSQALRAIRRRTAPADNTEGRDLAAQQGAATRQSVAAAVEGLGAARAGRRAAETGDTERWADQTAPAARYSATDYSIPVPAPRPERPAPGSRGNWPLVSPSDSPTGEPANTAGIGSEGYPSEVDAPPRASAGGPNWTVPLAGRIGSAHCPAAG